MPINFCKHATERMRQSRAGPAATVAILLFANLAFTFSAQAAEGGFLIAIPVKPKAPADAYRTVRSFPDPPEEVATPAIDI